MTQSPFLLLTDADNTLWDTDRVFAASQLALLKRLEETQGVFCSEPDRLQYVRRIDQALAAHHEGNLRYPIALLIDALRHALVGMTSSEAVARALERGPQIDDTGDNATASWFISDVASRTPILRDGVRLGLAELAIRPVRLVVVTESSESRCREVLDHHGIAQYFANIVSARKNPTLYAELARQHARSDSPRMMVGDQLDRDVAWSKQAGYVAVHFPGGFNPFWLQAEKDLPDYVVRNFNELPPIVDDVLRRERRRQPEGIDVPS